MHCPRLYNISRLPAIKRRVLFVIYMAFPNLLVENIFLLLYVIFFLELFLLFVHANKFNDYMTKRRRGREGEKSFSRAGCFGPHANGETSKVGNNNKWFYRFGRKTIKNKDAGGRSLKVCSFELAQQCRLTPFRSEIGRNVLFCFHRSYGSAGGERERE